LAYERTQVIGGATHAATKIRTRVAHGTHHRRFNMTRAEAWLSAGYHGRTFRVDLPATATVGASLDAAEICMTPGTEVLTPTGPQAIETLRVGYEVLTHRGRWRKITATSARPYVGTIVTAQAKGLRLVTATSNHPFRVQIAKPDRAHRILPAGEPDWMQAGELAAGRNDRR